ncbi:MAG: thioredoxin-dependent thiol peroxidase [bacterium]|nr:thioredoxin-dependent thiol peroxidase [bacterium]
MTTLTVGTAAPDFALPDQDGNKRRLRDWRGRWLLLYFYPKDDTPGCTKEACALRDSLPRFGKLKAAVAGVSVDSVASHAKFAKKYGLPFTLLADEGKAAVSSYGVWRQKTFMGRTYMGTMRTSFLIDPAGKIRKIYEGVKPAEHAAEVVGDLAALKRATQP